jgi:hypothetical protein
MFHQTTMTPSEASEGPKWNWMYQANGDHRQVRNGIALYVASSQQQKDKDWDLWIFWLAQKRLSLDN